MERIGRMMNPEPAVVGEGTPLDACALHMLRRDVRHLVVVDGDGRLSGVLSDWAVLHRGSRIGDDCWLPFDSADQWLQAGQLKQPVEVTAAPDEAAAEVLARLVGTVQDLAVVVDGEGKPLGVLSEHDAVVVASELLDDSTWSNDAPERLLRCVDHQAPALEAMQLMQTHHIRHVLVLKDGALNGVISYRDLVGHPDLDRTVTAADLLARERPLSVVGGMSLKDVAALMAAERIGILPVVNEVGRPVQVVSRVDLIRQMIEELNNDTPLPAEGARRASTLPD